MAKKSKKVNPVIEVVRLIEEGYSKDYIESFLTEKFKNLSADQILDIIREAKQSVEKECDTTHSKVLNLHVNRYRSEIKRLMAIEELPESEIGRTITFEEWQASRNRKIKAGLKAMDTMRLLENLLEIHGDSTTINLNDRVDITNNESKPFIPDLDKLTLEELEQLYDLYQEMKVKDNEPISVIVPVLSPISDVANTIPIIEEEPNVGLIKQEIKALPEDAANTLTPTQKLSQSLMKIAAQKFKDAGAKLDNREQQYLLNHNK